MDQWITHPTMASAGGANKHATLPQLGLKYFGIKCGIKNAQRNVIVEYRYNVRQSLMQNQDVTLYHNRFGV